MPTKQTSRIRVREGSGNIFADLGFPHAEQEQLKAQLTLEVYRAIKQRALTAPQVSAILGIKQPQVGRLMRGSSGSYSVERLFEFLMALGQDVEITLRPTRKPHGQLSVTLG